MNKSMEINSKTIQKNLYPQDRRLSGRLVTGLLMLLSGTLTAGDALVHQPVFRHPVGEPLVLYAMVSTDTPIDNVRLLFRPAGESGFEEEFMARYDDMWRGELPREYLQQRATLEYFIASTLTDGRILTFPETDPEEEPQTLEILPRSEIRETDRVPGRLAAGPEAVRMGAGEILILSPDQGDILAFDDIYIAASLYNISNVNVNAVRIRINGRDITRQATVSADFLSYSPPSLPPGKHTVQIEVRTLDGALIPFKTWSFTVVGEAREEMQREFTYQGKAGGSYSRDPQGSGSYLDVYKTSAAFTGNWRWLQFKTDLKLTSDEDPYKQPKNRYRLTFNLDLSDGITLNLGDFSSRLSRYTLDGKRVRGFGLNARFGWINLQVVKGALARPIQGRPAADQAYTLSIGQEQDAADSTSMNIVYGLDRKGYTFRRDLTTARLSFGSGRYFQWGVNVLKAKDAIASMEKTPGAARFSVQDSTFVDSLGREIVSIPGGTYTYDEFRDLEFTPLAGWNVVVQPPPELSWAGPSPQDNIVVGTDLKLNYRNRVSAQAGLAFSMLNTNIWEGPIYKDSLDVLLDDSSDGFVGRTYRDDGSIDAEGFALEDIPIDPSDYADLFVINQSMVPLIPIDMDSAQLADNPLRAILNMPSLAYNYKISTNFLKNRFSFEYNRTGPKFSSLGNPYLQADLREYIISDRIRLLKNKLLLGTTYRIQDNKTLRVVPTVTTIKNLTMNMGVFPGPGLPSLNLKFSVKPRYNDKEAPDTTRTDVVDIISGTDTTRDVTGYYLKDKRVKERTLTTTLGVNYRVSLLGLNHGLMLNYNRMKKEDQVPDRYQTGGPTYAVSAANDTTFFDTTFTSPALSSDVTTFSLVTQYPIPLKTTLVMSFNHRTAADGIQDIASFSLNATYDLFKRKLRVLGGLGVTTGSGLNEFTRLNLRGGVTYQLVENLALRVTSDLRTTKTGTKSLGSTILRADLNYTF